MSDDKYGATFHGGEELPRRDPFQTFAQHGAPPPVNPGRNAEAAPGVPPWGSLHQDIGHEPPRRSRVRSWNPIVWVLIGVALLALCGFGALALAGATGKAVENQVTQQAEDRKADITVTGCTLGEFDTVTVKYTVHNHSDQAQDYLPQFSIEDANGTVYGQAADIVNRLAPGKDYKGSAVGTIQEPGKNKITCKLTDA